MKTLEKLQSNLVRNYDGDDIDIDIDDIDLSDMM